MIRSRFFLVVSASLALLTVGSLVATGVTATACPLFGGKSKQGAAPQTGFSGGSRESGIRPASSPSDLQKSGIVGLGIITSAMGMGIAWKAYRSRREARVAQRFVGSPTLQSPELEHPELVIASLPKEALPSFQPLEKEVLLTR